MLEYRAPGVYIEETAAPGPISGVGTSTAAFVGPAESGETGVPVKVTNWTQFTERFGGFLLAPRSYLAHAVRGFFGNGGTVAYVVRVGTAVRASLELADRGSPPGVALVVRAKQEGTSGNQLTVAVEDAQIVPRDPGEPARVRQASAPIDSGAGTVVTLSDPADAQGFQPGDVVTIDDGDARLQIARIRGADLILQSALSAEVSAGTMRIADLAVDQRAFRVADAAGIERGSVLHLAQDGTEEDVVVEAVSGEFVTLARGLTETYSLAEGDTVEVTSAEFALVVSGPSGTERFDDLAMDPRHSRYVSRVVDSALVDVALPDTPSVQPPGANRPAVTSATPLTGGQPDDIARLGPDHYREALAALEKVDDVSLVCVPDRTDPAVQTAVIAHCERTQDRFAILDPAPRADLFGPGSVLEQRAALTSARGYAALYYPWIRISDPASPGGADTVLAPPSGHLAGIFARSDSQRGVHKAPANELINGALGLERILDDVEQGELNVEGINVLRVFPGRSRPVVWGARTTAPPDVTAWRYVNVRRLFLFVEESIQEGIRWAVFEPNDRSLWKQLQRTITEFLTRVWSSGALFGTTPAEAFYVKIDEENNPPPVRELGQIVIEIGIAPVRPAEFVVVRIGVWPGGADVQEG